MSKKTRQIVTAIVSVLAVAAIIAAVYFSVELYEYLATNVW